MGAFNPTANLALGITVDNRQGVASTNQFNNELKKIEQQAVSSTAKASGGFASMERSLVRMVASAATLAGAGGLVTWGIRVSASFERAQVGLRALVGDVQKADKIFEEVRDLAEVSPFEFSTLVETARRIKAVGFEAEQVIPILKSVDAAGGALDFDIGKLNDLVKAFGDIKAAGRLTGEEMRQLKNASIPALEFLQAGFGKTAAEIQRAIRDGLVPADAAIQAILDGINKKFGPSQEALGKTASVAFSNFRDAVERTADDIVRDYLPQITQATKDFTGVIKESSKFLIENKDLLATMAAGVGVLGAAFATYSLATWISGITASVLALNGAIALNPFGALALAVTAGGAAIYIEYKKGIDRLANAGREGLDAQIRGLVAEGKKAEEVVKVLNAQREEFLKVNPVLDGIGRALTVDDVKRALFGTADKIKIDLPVNIKLGGGAAAKEALKFGPSAGDGEKLARELVNLEKKGRDILQQARERLAAEEGGELARIYQDYDAKLAEVGKNARARADVAKALALEVQAVTLKTEREMNKAAEEGYSARLRRQFDAFTDFVSRTLGFQRETLALDEQLDTDRLDLRLAGLERQKTAEMKSLGEVGKLTVDQKLSLEQQKLKIETDFQEKILALRLEILDRQTAREIEDMTARATAEGIAAADIEARRLKLQEGAALKRKGLELDVQGAIEAARQDATLRSNDIVLDAYQTSFNRIRDGWERIFDFMTGKTKSWGAFAKSILTTTLLTPLRDFASSYAAALLTGGKLVQGGGRGGAIAVPGGGGGGLFGGLLSAFGGLGGGFGPQLGSGTTPGGTGTFTGAGISGLGGGPGGAGGLTGILGGFGGSVKSLGGFLAQLGQFGPKNVFGGLSNGSAIGGKLGGGLLLGGGILAADGLRRGGLLGALETTAGGALIGAKFGGPIGAAIGAGVGLTAGLIRSLFKSAEEKAKREIRSVYGVDVTERGIISQVLDIAKSSYGGNLPVAIRSNQVRDLVELFAMSSGQNFGGGLVNVQRPLQLVQTGGQTYQSPQRIGQASYVYPGSLGAAPGGVTTVVANFSLDGQATRAVMYGETVNAIASEGGAVAEAAAGAYRGGLASSSGRVSTLEPLTAPGA
jgi:tape measure domain-containing protein